MKRSLLTFLAIGCVGVAFAQQTWVHTSDNAKYSWAFVKGHGSEPAHVTLNAQGVNWTETVTRDEILVLREGGKYVITDSATLDNLVNATKPIERARNEYQEFKSRELKSRMKVRELQREVRSDERKLSLLESAIHRARSESSKADLQQQVSQLRAELRRNQTAVNSAESEYAVTEKKAKEMSDKKNAVRDEVNRKIERILDAAFDKGLAKRQ